MFANKVTSPVKCVDYYFRAHFLTSRHDVRHGDLTDRLIGRNDDGNQSARIVRAFVDGRPSRVVTNHLARLRLRRRQTELSEIQGRIQRRRVGHDDVSDDVVETLISKVNPNDHCRLSEVSRCGDDARVIVSIQKSLRYFSREKRSVPTDPQPHV